MQAGMLKVVPQAVLDLLTWQEVEKKVCGDPEISVEALKRLSECPTTVFIEAETLYLFVAPLAEFREDRVTQAQLCVNQTDQRMACVPETHNHKLTIILVYYNLKSFCF